MSDPPLRPPARQSPLQQVWFTSRRLWGVLATRQFDRSSAEGRSQERYRRVLLASLGAVVARAVTLLAALVSVPLAVGYLGAERYGMWMTASSLLVLLSFADLGIGNGLLNAISQADGQNDDAAKRRSVSSATWILAAVSVTLLALLALLYPFIPWPKLYNVTSELAVREAGPTTAIVLASFALNMPLGVVQNVQLGHQEGLKAHAWNLVGALCSLAGLLLAIQARAGLPWLALATTGGPVLVKLASAVVEFGFARRWLIPRFVDFDWIDGKRIMRTGSLFMFLQLCALLGSSSDAFVLAHLLGASSVALFSVTQRLFSVTQLAQYFIAPLWPAMGEAVARGDRAWAYLALRRALTWSFVLGLASAVPLVVAGEWILQVWVDPAWQPDMALLLGFGLWVLLAGYAGTMASVLNHEPLLGAQALYYALGSFAAFGLKFLLVPHWAQAGAIWATVIGYGVFFVVPAWRIAFGSLRQAPRPSRDHAGERR